MSGQLPTNPKLAIKLMAGPDLGRGGRGHLTAEFRNGGRANFE